MENAVILDVETTGLNPRRDNVILVGTLNLGSPYSVPDIRKKWDSSLEKYVVGHNVRFDAAFLKLSEKEHIFLDTEVLSRLHWPYEASYKLKDLMRIKFGEECKEQRDVLIWLEEEDKRRRKEKVETLANFGDIPVELLSPYLEQDLLYTRRLFEHLWPRLQDHPHLETELRLTNAIYCMEKRGWDVKKTDLGSMISTQEAALGLTMRSLESMQSRPVNINSPKQVGEYITEELKIKLPGKTPTGQPKVDKSVLSRWAHIPWVSSYLKSKAVSKMLNTYYKPISNMMDSDRLYPSYRQIGAITGRMSCASPNLQNIPRGDPLRGLFTVAGRKLAFMDYNQIELRIFAHYAEDQSIIEAFRRGEDLHSKTATALFNVITPSSGQRQIAKTINFALIYGAGPKRIMEQLAADGQLFSYGEVKNFIGRYYKAYPAVNKFMSTMERAATVDGYVKDIWGYRHIVKPEEAYKVTNYLIQGTAAQVMKKSFVALHEAGHDIRNVIHDEFVLAYRLGDEKTLDDAVRLAEDRATFRVPITVSTKFGFDNWGDKT